MFRHSLSPFIFALLAAMLAGGAAPGAAAEGVDEEMEKVVEMSLEELLQVEVTSVGKKSQRLADVAAAVHVITREDIRRSGATSLPEGLRLAPGVDSVRISDNRWAVSIRGFNGRWANKLLIQVDGRSVYTPLYSGTDWEQENVPLSLIERIEVIRGPAAATWGANAVSGVINIITRRAADTPGLQGEVSVGNQGFRAATVSKGLEVNPDTHLRIFATGDELGADERVDGEPSNTRGRRVRAGLRLDHVSAGADYSLFTEAWRGWGSTTNISGWYEPPFYLFVDYSTLLEGAVIMGRRQGKTAAGNDSSLQASLEHVYNENTLGWTMQRNTLDVDYHQRHAFDSGADLIWGVGYRLHADRMGEPTATIAYSPRERTLSTFSLYAQGDLPLIGQGLGLSLGARLERHTYTGWEFQPNARLSWHVDERSSAWISASRAVRTPSRTERDARFDFMGTHLDTATGDLIAVAMVSSDRFESETLDAIEAGYRTQLTPRLSLDLAAYLHRYDGLRGARLDRYLDTDPWHAPSLVIADLAVVNGVNADVRGAEASLDWRLRDDWRLAAAWSLGRLSFRDGSQDTTEDLASRPRYILSLRSSHDLSEHLKLDFWLRRTAERNAQVVPFRHIPAFSNLDARLAWTPRKGLELSLVGQNLLKRRHVEFVSDIFITAPVYTERRGYLQARWQF